MSAFHFTRGRKFPHRRRGRFFGLLLLACLALGGAGWFAFSGSSAPLAGTDKLQEYPQGPLADGLRFDRLLLEKSARRLTAFSKDKPVRVYRVALGGNPVGHKEARGDKRTPEGRYTINDKNPESAYFRNLGISYPNAEDIKRARARGGSPGGDIKIHGLAPAFADLGAAHLLTDWTYGCIAVTNPEIQELFDRTPVGIPIEIVP